MLDALRLGHWPGRFLLCRLWPTKGWSEFLGCYAGVSLLSITDYCNASKRNRYKAGFLHQKVMLVDDDIATVGTANFDNRSFRLNFEITTVFADRDFNNQVAQMLKCDFAQSELTEILAQNQQRWTFKLTTRVARLFAPVI